MKGLSKVQYQHPAYFNTLLTFLNLGQLKLLVQFGFQHLVTTVFSTSIYHIMHIYLGKKLLYMKFFVLPWQQRKI